MFGHLRFGESIQPAVSRMNQLLIDKNIMSILSSKLFARNDFIAIEAMEAMAELGLDMPGGISLIGYDNLKIPSILQVKMRSI